MSMGTLGGRQFKDRVFEQFARIGGAVSSPKRLELLDLLGLGLSALVVRETHAHVGHEVALGRGASPAGFPSPQDVFWKTTLTDRDLSAVTQAGLVNNLNDGMAWGLFPLVFVAAGASPSTSWTSSATSPVPA